MPQVQEIGFVCPYPDHPVWMEYHPHCFCTFVFNPTQSNNPISLSNSVWIHTGLVEATTLLYSYKNSACTFNHAFPPSVCRRPSLCALIICLSGWADSSSLLLSLSSPPTPSATRDYQWRTTASTTTSNMMGKIGSPTLRLSQRRRIFCSTPPPAPPSVAAPKTCGGGRGP